MSVEQNNAVHTVKAALLDHLIELKHPTEQEAYRYCLDDELLSNASLLHLYRKLPEYLRPELRSRVLNPSCVSCPTFSDGKWHDINEPNWVRVLDNLDTDVNVIIPKV